MSKAIGRRWGSFPCAALFPWSALLVLTGCGGNGGSSPTYTVSSTVSGLVTGASVVLQDNGADNLTVTANGSLAFHTPIASGGRYAVTVQTAPSGEMCTVSGGTGTVAGADVTNVMVGCVPIPYSIAVNVVGLLPNKNLVLQNNGTDSLTAAGGGTFIFTKTISSGSTYSVSITSQPTGQTCTVTGGGGTVAAANVAVTVTCPWHVLYTGSYLSGDTEAVSGFAIDPTSGAIAALPTETLVTGNSEDTGFAIAADSSGKHLYLSSTFGPNAANQTENDIYNYGIDSSTGALVSAGSPAVIAPVGNISAGPVLINPGGTFAYTQPQGPILSVNSTSGVLTPTGGTAVWASTLSPQGNPYGSCAFGASGSFAYCTSAPSQNTVPEEGVVVLFGLDPSTGVATPMSSTAAGAFPHDIVITPNGKFAYVPDGSNIWAYEIDPNSGALTPLAASPIGVPQHIAEITVNANGSGIYVLQTGSLIGYAIDPASGALTSVPGVIAIEAPIATPSPQMQIDPSGKFVFVPGGGNQIYAASINATTGALTPVTGSPFNVAIPGVVYNSLGPVTFAIAAVLP